VGQEDAGLDRVGDRAALDTPLTELEERDRLLVTLYYRQGQTQAQIGERLGCSQMHVSRLLRRAVKRLELATAA
jgi:RNA polymerase sigma-B factor